MEGQLQNFRNLILKDVEAMIHSNIHQIRQEILSSSKHRMQHQIEINRQISQIKRDNKLIDQQLNGLKEDIAQIRSQLQLVSHSQKQLKDLKQEIQLINKNYRELSQKKDNEAQKQKQPSGSFEEYEEYQEYQQSQENEENEENQENEEQNFDFDLQQITNKHEEVCQELQAFKTEKRIHKVLIDPRSQYIGNFKIKMRVIELVDGMLSYQLLGNVPVGEKKKNKFVIRSIKGGMIDIGVIDRRYIQDRNSFNVNREQCICYNGRSGNVYEGGKNQKTGLPMIKKDEKITMIVKGSLIKWKLRKQVYYFESSLVNKNWVPFIIMHHTGDIVHWS